MFVYIYDEQVKDNFIKMGYRLICNPINESNIWIFEYSPNMKFSKNKKIRITNQLTF